MIYITASEQETEQLATTIAEAARPGSLYCLCGELGAGKTVFARGFARGLGITEPVTSPTFCLLNIYDGRDPLYHFDVYRLSPHDTDDICLPDYIDGAGICLIEWAENIKELLPNGAVWIYIKKLNDDEREIDIRC